jgi:hypothetical protein
MVTVLGLVFQSSKPSDFCYATNRISGVTTWHDLHEALKTKKNDIFCVRTYVLQILPAI